ncbi:hypothetical protein [Phocaeicola dorei]|uniref:hypothetical protein n=1 Tax=Phocaeicola dorei TaxID=357276 RepID=UPI00211E6D4E|nr:hypothetical protein [Phocaeicola dorei]
MPSGSDRQTASQAFLEPQSEMADKVNDKMEAYKQDKLEEQEKARILKESQVKGSDFYFELQNQQERYDRATLERIRRMQNDPYSEVMAEYGGGRNGRFSHQLESQLDGLEDEQALNEIIREAKKNSRIRKELEESDKYRKRMYERIVNYDQEEKRRSRCQPFRPSIRRQPDAKRPDLPCPKTAKRVRANRPPHRETATSSGLASTATRP